jgi:hypothetical protein
MMKVWVVMVSVYEDLEPDGSRSRRYDEVMRLPGAMAPAEVAVIMEYEYARVYQLGWTENSLVEERATVYADDAILVGHDPQFLARLVRVLEGKS